jgi:hypothetical protein
MGTYSATQRIALGLVLLMTVVAATAVQAQTTLQGQIVARPLSNDDAGAYKLTGAENSGGLSTVGLGQPAYLEAEIDINVPASEITGVAWALASKPSGSSATLADSPLGKNVPIWEPSDRLVLQVAGRTLLRPDVVGQYHGNRHGHHGQERGGQPNLYGHCRYL